MTKNYCFPQIPKMYWVKKIRYICKNCGYKFESSESKGNDIIKYQEENGEDIKWLPTYGNGGYLYLLKKLVPNFAENDEISMSVSNEFSMKFKKYIEPSPNGNPYVVAINNRVCPKCNSSQLDYKGEHVEVCPNVQWLKISCELIK